MANKVFINSDQIVEIIVDGDQTVASVTTMGNQALELAQAYKRKNKPALILDNLLSKGSVPVDARSVVVDLIKSRDFDKLAMVGSGGIIKIGANLILQASGKGSRVKYFDSYELATNWLLAP